MNDETAPSQEQKKNNFWEIIKFTVIALIIVIPIRLFIAQPFVVSGASMVPTFENGDYLIIDEISYRFHEPERGDVIVFRFPEQPDKFFIKRIIGLPGETVTVRDNTLSITPIGSDTSILLDELYLHGIETTGNFEKNLDSDEYFVMGDNRTASSDSRAWGPLPKDLIIGRAWIRLFPLKELGYLPGNIDFSLEPNDVN